MYEWNDGGRVEGPNGELELDPDNQQCIYSYRRPVFATCKNNCPGGELLVITYNFYFVKMFLFR